MSRYRKVEVGVWTDGKFQALSPAPPNGQTLWLYLLSGPRTTIIPGAVVAREAVLADDLGWKLEAFRETLGEALREGLIEVDRKGGLILLKRALLDRHGDPRESARPESPNVIKSWAKAWPEIPDCELKNVLLQRLGAFAEALGPAFAKAFSEGFAKALAKASPHPSPNQEQEQEQEKEQEKNEACAESAPPPAAPPPAPPATPPAAPPALALVGGLEMPRPVIEIPTNTGKPWPIYEEMVAEWEPLFPGVDVRQALRNIAAWNVANPKRRKTATGMRRHIVNWLTEDQNKGRCPPAGGTGPSVPRGPQGNADTAGAWTALLGYVRDARTPPDPLLAHCARELGGVDRLGQLNDFTLNRERPRFDQLYRAGLPPAKGAAHG